MHLEDCGVRARAGRPIEPRQQRAAALALVFDIFDAHALALLGPRLALDDCRHLVLRHVNEKL